MRWSVFCVVRIRYAYYSILALPLRPRRVGLSHAREMRTRGEEEEVKAVQAHQDGPTNPFRPSFWLCERRDKPRQAIVEKAETGKDDRRFGGWAELEFVPVSSD